MSLTLKLFSLVTRTAAKPIGNYIKQQAREHDRFRALCVSFAQRLHRLDMRMKLGLLQDTAAIDRQIKREAAEAEEKRLRAQHRPSSTTPTVKTEEQMKADQEAREREKKFIEGKVKNEEKRKGLRMIRPLSEAKAIDMGANFISEGFVFGVAVGLLLFETWRNKRKENSRRGDVKEKMDWLEDEIKLSQEERGLLEDHVAQLREELETLKQRPDPATTQGSPNKEIEIKDRPNSGSNSTSNDKVNSDTKAQA